LPEDVVSTAAAAPPARSRAATPTTSGRDHTRGRDPAGPCRVGRSSINPVGASPPPGATPGGGGGGAAPAAPAISVGGIGVAEPGASAPASAVGGAGTGAGGSSERVVGGASTPLVDGVSTVSDTTGVTAVGFAIGNPAVSAPYVARTAETNSRHVRYRSSGRFESAFAITPSSEGGRSGRFSVTGGAGSTRCA
jgi:hypothetical protein